MPQPKNSAAYPARIAQIYTEATRITAEPLELTFETKNQAARMRFVFYGFKAALEREFKQKSKDHPYAHLRGRLDEVKFVVQGNTLRIMNREKSRTALDLEAALDRSGISKEQLAKDYYDTLAQERPQDILQPAQPTTTIPGYAPFNEGNED